MPAKGAAGWMRGLKVQYFALVAISCVYRTNLVVGWGMVSPLQMGAGLYPCAWVLILSFQPFRSIPIEVVMRSLRVLNTDPLLGSLVTVTWATVD